MPAPAETNLLSRELTPPRPTAEAPRPTAEPETLAPLRLPDAEQRSSQPSDTAVKASAAKPNKVQCEKFRAGLEATPTVLQATQVKRSGFTRSIQIRQHFSRRQRPGSKTRRSQQSPGCRPPVSQPAFGRQPDLHEESSKEAGERTAAGRISGSRQIPRQAASGQDGTDALTQFGVSFLVVPKNLFWKKTYQVLVGPYSSDHEAEVAHTDLASHGFPARPFERGKRELTLHTALTLGRPGSRQEIV